jgi:hypothetical protein
MTNGLAFYCKLRIIKESTINLSKTTFIVRRNLIVNLALLTAKKYENRSAEN